MPSCLGLYRLIFQYLYHTSLIPSKRETDEIVNFRNFASCSQKKLPRFCGILAPHFQTGKMRRSDKGNEACYNGLFQKRYQTEGRWAGGGVLGVTLTVERVTTLMICFEYLLSRRYWFLSFNFRKFN